MWIKAKRKASSNQTIIIVHDGENPISIPTNTRIRAVIDNRSNHAIIIDRIDEKNTKLHSSSRFIILEECLDRHKDQCVLECNRNDYFALPLIHYRGEDAKVFFEI